MTNIPAPPPIKKKAKRNTNPEHFKSLPIVTDLPTERFIRPKMPSFDAQKLDGNFKGYIPGYHHPEYYAASNQSPLELTLKGAGKLAVGFVGALAEGAALAVATGLNPTMLADPWMEWIMEHSDDEEVKETWGSIRADQDINPGLIAARGIRQARDWVNEKGLKIYDTPTSNNMFDPRWLANNMESVGSFASSIVPGIGAAKVASWALRGPKLLGKLGKYLSRRSAVTQTAIKRGTGAAAQRYFESSIEGYALYDELIKEGYSEEYARQAMMRSMRYGAALIVPDLLQMRYLLKPIRSVGDELFDLGAKKQKDNLAKRAGKYFATQMLPEGPEEVYQTIAGEESKRILAGEDDPGRFIFGKHFFERVPEYAADNEVWTSAIMGVLGGGFAGPVMSGMNTIFKQPPKYSEEFLQRQRDQFEKLMTQDEQTYLNSQSEIRAFMHFTGDNRLYHLEDYLDKYIEKHDGTEDAARKVSVDRAKSFRENLTEMKEDLFDAMNKNRGPQYVSAVMQEKYGLKNTEKLKLSYESKLDELYGDTPLELRELHELKLEKQLFEYEIAQEYEDPRDETDEVKKKRADLEARYERKRNDLISKGFTEADILNEQDIFDNYVNLKYTNEHIDTHKKHLKQIQTEKGFDKYMKDYELLVKKSKEEWYDKVSTFISDGALVGDGFNRFEIKKHKDPDKYYLKRKYPNRDKIGAEGPMSEDEVKKWHENKVTTPRRRVAIAGKLSKGEGLTFIEQEIVNQIGEEEIQKLSMLEGSDNGGKGYTRSELMDFMTERGMELMEVTQEDINLDRLTLRENRIETEKKILEAKEDHEKVKREIARQESLMGTPEYNEFIHRTAKQSAEVLEENIDTLESWYNNGLWYKIVEARHETTRKRLKIKDRLAEEIEKNRTEEEEDVDTEEDPEEDTEESPEEDPEEDPEDPPEEGEYDKLSEFSSVWELLDPDFISQKDIKRLVTYLEVGLNTIEEGTELYDHVNKLLQQAHELSKRGTNDEIGTVRISGSEDILTGEDLDNAIDEIEAILAEAVENDRNPDTVADKIQAVYEIEPADQFRRYIRDRIIKKLPEVENNKSPFDKWLGITEEDDPVIAEEDIENEEITEEIGEKTVEHEVFMTTITGHKKRSKKGKRITIDNLEDALVTDTKAIRFVNWVADTKVYGEGYKLRLFTVTDRYNNTDEDAVNMLFSSEGERIAYEKKRAHLDNPYENIIYGVVTDKNGNFINADGIPINAENIADEGLITYMIESDGYAMTKRLEERIDDPDRRKVLHEQYAEKRKVLARAIREGQPVTLDIIRKKHGKQINTGDTPVNQAVKGEYTIGVVTKRGELVSDQNQIVRYGPGTVLIKNLDTDTIYRARGRKLNANTKVGRTTINEPLTVYHLLEHIIENGWEKVDKSTGTSPRLMLRHYLSAALDDSRGDVQLSRTKDGKVIIRYRIRGGEYAEFANLEDLREAKEDIIDDLQNKRHNIMLEALNQISHKYKVPYYDPVQKRFRTVTTKPYKQYIQSTDVLVVNAPPATAAAQHWNPGLVLEPINVSKLSRAPVKRNKVPRYNVAATYDIDGTDISIVINRDESVDIYRKDEIIVEDALLVGYKNKTGSRTYKSYEGTRKGKKFLRDSIVLRIDGEQRIFDMKKHDRADKPTMPLVDDEDLPTKDAPTDEGSSVFGPAAEPGEPVIDLDDFDDFEDFGSSASEFEDDGDDSVTIGNIRRPRIVSNTAQEQYAVMNLNDEYEWLQQKLPQFPIRLKAGLIKQGVWGYFSESAEIVLDPLAERGTMYHEAWHAVTEGILSRRQVKRLYKTYRKEYEAQGLTDDQVEEKLAEMFREYILTGVLPKKQNKKRGYIEKIFDDIIRAINALFGITHDIDVIFSRINNGYYSTAPVRKRPIKRRNRTNTTTIEGTSTSFTVEAVNDLHMHYVHAIRERNLFTQAVTGRLSPQQVHSLYRVMYNRLRELYDGNVAELNKKKSLYKKRWDRLDYEEKKEINDELSSIKNRVNQLAKLSENFNKAETGPTVIELHSKILKQYDAQYDEQYMDLFEKEDFQEDYSTHHDNDWVINDNNTNPWLTATKEIRFWMNALPLYEYAENGDMVPVNTENGFLKPFKNAYGIVGETLAGTTDVTQQAKRLFEMAEHFPSLYLLTNDMNLAQDESGNVNMEMDGTDFDRRAQFFQTMARYKESFFVDLVDENKITRVRANDNTDVRDIKRTWQQGFAERVTRADFFKDMLAVIENARFVDKSVFMVNAPDEYRTFDDRLAWYLRDENMTLDVAISLAQYIGFNPKWINYKDIRGDYFATEASQKKFMRIISYMVHKLGNMRGRPNLDQWIYRPENDVSVNQLVRMDMENDPDYREGSHTNADGDSVYDRARYTYEYYVVSKLNEIADMVNKGHISTPESAMKKIFQVFPHMDKPYFRNSAILNIVAQGGTIETGIEEDISRGFRAKSTGSTTYSDRLIKEMVDMIYARHDYEGINHRAVYQIIQPGENSLVRTYSLKRGNIPGGIPLIDMNAAVNIDEGIDILMNYLADELEYVMYVRDNPEKYGHTKDFTKNLDTNSREKMGIVASMLSDEKYDEIFERFFDDEAGTREERMDALLSEQSIREGIRSTVDAYSRIDVEPLIKDYKIRNVANIGDAWDADITDKQIADYISVTHIANMVEQTKLWHGHPAMFKDLETMLKRAKAMVSPKSLSMNDLNTNEFLKKHTDPRIHHMMKEIKIGVARDPAVVSTIAFRHGDAPYYYTQRVKDMHAVNYSKEKGVATIDIKYRKSDMQVKIDMQNNKVISLKGDGIMEGVTLEDQEKLERDIDNNGIGGKVFDLAGEMYYQQTGNPLFVDAGLRVIKHEPKADLVTPIGAMDNIYLDALKERFPEKYAKAKADLYAGYEEANGHAFISLPVARLFEQKQGTWNQNKEMAYEWQMQGGWKGRKVVIPKDNMYRDLQGLEVTKDMIGKDGYLLGSYKPHAYGPTKEAGHMNLLKFAMTPLLPEVIAGRKHLQDLNEKMMKEGYGMQIFDSGNKTAVPLDENGDVYDLFDSRGNVRMNASTPVQTLRWEYIGTQIPTPKETKTKASLGTQKEVMIEEDLVTNGVPVDFIERFAHQSVETKSIGEAVAGAELTSLEQANLSGERITLSVYDEQTGKQEKILFDSHKKAYERNMEEITKLYDDTYDQDTEKTILRSALGNINIIRKSNNLSTRRVDTILSKIYGTDKAYDAESAKAAWNNLSTEDKRKNSKIYDTIQEIRKLNAANINLGMEFAINDLGLIVERDGDGKTVYKVDPEKIDKFKRKIKESIRRDIPPAYLDGIDYIDGSVELALPGINMSQILNSIVTKRSTRRKVSGKNSVLVPPTLIGFDRKMVYEDKDNNRLYSASDLKSYENEDGKITKMEVYMPHYFKELAGKDVDINNVDPRLLEIIGFRIPTQALSSIESIVIKGFLPQTAGDMVIPPSDIVVKTGSDYDWDKLFLSLPNYEIVNGKPTYLKYETNEVLLWNKVQKEFTLEYDSSRYHAIRRNAQLEIEKIIKERDVKAQKITELIASSLLSGEDSDLRKMLNNIFESEKSGLLPTDSEIYQEALKVDKVLQESVEKIREINQKMEDAYDELYNEAYALWSKLPIEEKNGHKRLDNYKMEKQKELLSLERRFAQMMAPITMSKGAAVFKDLSDRLEEMREKKMRELIDKGVIDEKKELVLKEKSGFSNLTRFRWHNERKFVLTESRKNVGTAALIGKAHKNFAKADAFMHNTFVVLDHNKTLINKGDRKVYAPSLAGIKTQDNKYYISDLINELTTAYLDSPNDAFIHEINGTGENAVIIGAMLLKGISPDTIVAFMNNPVINWYNKELDKNKGLVWEANKVSTGWQPNTVFTKQFQKKLREMGDIDDSNLNFEIINDSKRLWGEATIPVLYDSEGNPIFSNLWDMEMQYAVFEQYLILKKAAQKMMSGVSNLTYDTKHGGKDILTAMMQVMETELKINDSVTGAGMTIGNFEKIIEGDGYLKPFYEAVKQKVEMLAPFEALMHPQVRDMTERLMLDLIYDTNAYPQQKEKVLNAFRTEFMTMIYQLYYRGDKGEGLWENRSNLILTNKIEEREVNGKIKTVQIKNSRNPDSVPYRVSVLQEQIKAGNRAPNYFIEMLLPKLRNKIEVFGNEMLPGTRTPAVVATDDGKKVKKRKEVLRVDNMTLQGLTGKRPNANEMQRYIDAVDELRISDPQLVDDIFDFLMMQSGTSYMINNFINAFPPEYFADKMAKPLERFYTAFNSSDHNHFLVEFATNMTRSKSIFRDLYPGNKWPFYKDNNNYYYDGYLLSPDAFTYADGKFFVSTKRYRGMQDVREREHVVSHHNDKNSVDERVSMQEEKEKFMQKFSCRS